jgi:hypothetical protein
VKIVIFWDVMECSLVEETNVMVEPVAFIFKVGEQLCSEDGSSRFLYLPTRLHGVTTQKTIIFYYNTVRNPNLTSVYLFTTLDVHL